MPLINKAGFTLVELAIVLVIIGLLVGGVLVARDLVTVAKTRAGIAQLTELQASVGAFRGKYLKLPGDIPNASQFFSAASQPQKVSDGNGNGTIDVVWTSNLNGWDVGVLPEPLYVYEHLIAAGFVTGQYYDESDLTGASKVFDTGIGYPEAKFESKGTAYVDNAAVLRGNDRPGILIGTQIKNGYIPARNVLQVGICRYRQWGGNYVAGECGINPEEAKAVDDKMDDGIPSTGSVIAYPNHFYALPSNGFGNLISCTNMTTDTTTGDALTPGTYSLNLDRNRGCVIEVSLGM